MTALANNVVRLQYLAAAAAPNPALGSCRLQRSIGYPGLPSVSLFGAIGAVAGIAKARQNVGVSSSPLSIAASQIGTSG